MLAKISCLLQQPFYFWLVAVYPILYLYTMNFGLVIDREFSVSVICMLVATTIGFIVTNAVLHNCHKTALIVSSISVCFSLEATFTSTFHSLVLAGEPLTVWTVFVLIAITIVVTELNKVHSDGFFEHVTPH